MDTEQEKFWAGSFGDEYTVRNQSEKVLSSNIALFSRIFHRAQAISSVIEFGLNVGLNLRAIHTLLPTAALAGVELNSRAAAELSRWGKAVVHQQSILDFNGAEKYDLSFTKGVLIHINPDRLPDVYRRLYESSRRYLMVAEYYNPSPTEVSYRGHEGKLFKRDFAGDLLDAYADLRLIDYGFAYRRDEVFPQDDITWFLLEKGLRKPQP